MGRVGENIEGGQRAGAARQARRAARGFTLIELTVILAVIVTLTLILTPTVANFISDARVARARTDVQTIAGAIVQFYRDTGFYPQWSTAQFGGPGLPTQRVELLVSPGNLPGEAPPSPWTTSTRVDALVDQLITNAPGYAMRAPRVELGWNGPYVSSELGPDPWGNRYMVNIGMLDGSQEARTRRAVWVISAGSNGAIETVFAQPITTATFGGDDIGIRLW